MVDDLYVFFGKGMPASVPTTAVALLAGKMSTHFLTGKFVYLFLPSLFIVKIAQSKLVHAQTQHNENARTIIKNPRKRFSESVECR